MIIDLDTLCRRHIPCEIQFVVIVSSCIVWVIKVIVTLVAVVAVVLTRGMVCDAAIINLVGVVEALFISVLADVVIALDFSVTVTCIGDVLSDTVVGALVADVIMVFVTGANVNVFTSLMTALELGLPKPLG